MNNVEIDDSKIMSIIGGPCFRFVAHLLSGFTSNAQLVRSLGLTFIESDYILIDNKLLTNMYT